MKNMFVLLALLVITYQSLSVIKQARYWRYLYHHDVCHIGFNIFLERNQWLVTAARPVQQAGFFVIGVIPVKARTPSKNVALTSMGSSVLVSLQPLCGLIVAFQRLSCRESSLSIVNAGRI